MDACCLKERTFDSDSLGVIAIAQRFDIFFATQSREEKAKQTTSIQERGEKQMKKSQDTNCSAVKAFT